MGTTYATPLAEPPYNWSQKWVGLANLCQIPVAFIALPVLGIFSDKMITFMARRNGGVHEPEVRLLALVFPIFIGIVGCLLFGAAYQYPYKFSWFALVFGYVSVWVLRRQRMGRVQAATGLIFASFLTGRAIPGFLGCIRCRTDFLAG